jgi:8-oxo-dGTP pyrophosphatase MutT (NUDIX family)
VRRACHEETGANLANEPKFLGELNKASFGEIERRLKFLHSRLQEGRSMVKPRHREIASAIIIDIRGRFLLQQRDEVAGIAQPGKIGLFGGHREAGETYLECVVREIYEEISYFISPGRFEHLVSYNGTEFDVDGDTIRSEFFIVRPVEALNITEGSLLVVEPDKLVTIEHKLAPSVRFAMKALAGEIRPTTKA